MWRSDPGGSARRWHGRGALFLAAGYGAGLLTGLAHFPDPIVVTVVIAIVACLAGGAAWAAAFAVAIGALAGGGARSAEGSRCADRLTAGTWTYHLHLVDPGAGTGRVRLVGVACRGAVTARWPAQARLGAGFTVVASAEWQPRKGPFGRADGLLAVARIDSMGGSPDVIDRFRNAIAAGARALYGRRAPLVEALVAGWRGEIDPDLRADFAASGMTFLLAISGLHVACLAGWLLLLLRLTRVERHRARFVAAAAALGYSAFLGLPAPALRASALLLVVAWCRWRQRQALAGAVIAVSALAVMVVDPWSLASAGAWMSFAGVSGVLMAVRWSDRALGTAWLIRTLSASTGALLATAPIASAVFGRVAPVSIALSAVSVPLLGAMLPVLVLSLALRSTVAVVAAAFAATGNGLLALVEFIVHAGAHAPGASPGADASPHGALLWACVAAGAAWAISGRATAAEALRRSVWVCTLLVWITLPTGLRPRSAIDHRTLTLVFVNVGQGDGALIETPAGHWLEVDAGPVEAGYDAGRRAMVPELVRRGASRIDMFVLSHAHRDHVGGGAAVLDRIPVDLALEPGELFSDAVYDAWLGALPAHHVRWRAVRAGARWTIDSVDFRVLHPPVPWDHEGEDLNEDSIVLEVNYRGFRALLMGDAGFVAESALAGKLHPVDVLKVGHHGSATATGAAFLAEVRPRVAVVSVGRNRYGHPSPSTLARLAASGALVLRTDRRGTIAITTDGSAFTVSAADTTATFRVTR